MNKNLRIGFKFPISIRFKMQTEDWATKEKVIYKLTRIEMIYKDRETKIMTMLNLG